MSGAGVTTVARPAPRVAGGLARALSTLNLGWALLVLVGVFIVLTFNQYGISNDEEVQHVYGRLLLAFYGSGFTDHAAFEYKNLYLYGGLFDLIAAGLERLLPSINVWDLRHLLSALFGLGGLTGTWLLARRLAGGPAALAALVVLVLTGAWTGAMFTHTKDVPFATTMVWSLLFIVRILPSLPRPARGDVIGLGIAIGCAFGLRVGAVFAVFYLGVGMMAAAWVRADDPGARLSFFWRSLRALLPAAGITFVLMGVFWPWAMMSPANLVRAMTAFSHFSFELDTILGGAVMKNGDVPGYYLSWYLLVRLPELFLLGLVLGLVTALRMLPRLRKATFRRLALPWLPLILAVGVPLGYTLLAAPPLYNGIRHFTFLLPPLAVIAGIGLTQAWLHAARFTHARRLATACCAALALGHGAALAHLHPYEYVAYNGLAGGLAGTVDEWEQDYWGASLREAALELNAYVAHEGKGTPHYTVAVCAEALQAQEWLAPGLTVTSDWAVADFFLSPTQMGCDRALKGRVIGSVVREGVPLAIIRDRRHLIGDERIPL
ncbi:MAG: hypothetical protein AB7S62_09970 [Azoarcus sp.]